MSPKRSESPPERKTRFRAKAIEKKVEHVRTGVMIVWLYIFLSNKQRLLDIGFLPLNPIRVKSIYCNFLDFSLAASALACLANLAFFL